MLIDKYKSGKVGKLLFWNYDSKDFKNHEWLLGLGGLPRWLSGKESACQCRRQGICSRGFDPSGEKIPWKRKWQLTPVGCLDNLKLSSILAWTIPWTEEPGRLQSMGSQRVRYNLVTDHAHFKSMGLASLVEY